jgi:hypothetical protein
MEERDSAGVSGVLATFRDSTAEYRQTGPMLYAARTIGVVAAIVVNFMPRMAGGEAVVSWCTARNDAMNGRLNRGGGPYRQTGERDCQRLVKDILSYCIT